MLEDYHCIESNYRRQSYPEYYQTLYSFADILDAIEVYNRNRPDYAPAGDRFRGHVSAMREFGIGADRGDALFKAQRQYVRDLSELDMDAAISYLRILAIEKRDPSLLHGSGLPLKESPQKVAHRALSPEAIEIHLTVKHLKGVSGGIVIEGVHMRNGGPYLINLCKGEPVSEDSWYNPGGHHNSCSRIIYRGLEPASRYYIRMRTDGPNGPGPWCQTVSIIVL